MANRLHNRRHPPKYLPPVSARDLLLYLFPPKLYLCFVSGDQIRSDQLLVFEYFIYEVFGYQLQAGDRQKNRGEQTLRDPTHPTRHPHTQMDRVCQCGGLFGIALFGVYLIFLGTGSSKLSSLLPDKGPK